MTDEKFVLDLYLHVLGREPDPDGVTHWTGVLADGASRSDVLELFMSSPEFLSLRDVRERCLGLSSEFAHLSVPEKEILVQMQRRVAELEKTHPAQEHAGANKSSSKVSDLETISASVRAAKEALGQLTPSAPDTSGLLKLNGKSANYPLTWYTPALQAFHEHITTALEEHGKAIAAIEQSLTRMQQELQGDSLQGALRTAELAIQEQLVHYIDFFREVSPIVDLGCGRGEFLELLRKQGISAYGVDSDPQACEVVREKGLTVFESDVVEHLRQLPESSLGGIFTSRLVEYLPEDMRIDFLTLCSSRLKPRGVVVIETTNPHSHQGFGRTSNLDTSHLRPLPPELIKSLLESKNIHDVRISILAPVEATLTGAEASGEVDSQPEVLAGASRRLSSSSTYAVVGRRKPVIGGWA